MAALPPLLAAGTGVDGAQLWRLSAGRRGFGAFGCGKTGVGCRRAAMAAGRSEIAADKERVDAGRRGTAQTHAANAAISAKRWIEVVGGW
ncbi:MAG: hypothetical protein JNJ78_15025 [Anaerolineae bacterium]|nr:hypothetical protein [Anaerolineae bacterium]